MKSVIFDPKGERASVSKLFLGDATSPLPLLIMLSLSSTPLTTILCHRVRLLNPPSYPFHTIAHAFMCESTNFGDRMRRR